jgi:zona occludens toxin
MGKTALLVSLLLKMQGTRPIYVMGIPDLTIEHQDCPPIAEWTECRRDDPHNPDLEMHYFTFPPHSLIVIDESQRVYRPRSTSSKVPPHVAAFETVRHTGVEFYLLTQSPRLLDTNIRPLVGKHIAIGRRLLGRYTFEWPYVGDLDSKMSREEASKRRYSPPKAAFKHYKSAEVHIANRGRVHQIWYLAAAALGFLAYQGWGAYQVFQRNTPAALTASRADTVPRSSAVQNQPAPAPVSPTTSAMVVTESDDPFHPVNPGRPESAPAYSALAIPVAMPVVSACVASRDKCVCYSQQATRLIVPENVCRQWAISPDFNPYRLPAAPSASPSA